MTRQHHITSYHSRTRDNEQVNLQSSILQRHLGCHTNYLSTNDEISSFLILENGQCLRRVAEYTSLSILLKTVAVENYHLMNEWWKLL